ncbi:MAG: aminotransferase [Deltaproteobacteria bacterium]|nr:aminotransferase [Deltaproteobacteria bacterium]
MKPTARSKRINPFYVMELLEQARDMERSGRSVVHMEIGEPDFPTPKRVKDAAIRAIKQGRTFYTESLGLPELREKIAQHYRKLHGVRVSPERVVVTNGTSGAFLLLASVLLSRRRNLVLPDPGYPCYKNFGMLADATIRPVHVSVDSRFEITPKVIDRLSVVPHVLLIANPSNPTGSLYADESLARLWDAVSWKGGLMVVDEIYSGLVYDRTFRTALSLSDEIIVVNGLSKTHAMTGWRLGWMVVPQALVRPIQKVAQNVFISAPTIAQYAALEAIDASQAVEEMRQTYLKRRNYLVPALRRLGFSVPIMPRGAFYVYAGIERWRMDSMEFVQRALKDALVAITPGYDFGAYLADSHVRFSYANDLDQLKEGCRRIGRWLRTL